MTRKNPDNKHLEIVFTNPTSRDDLGNMLALLAIAESNLVKAGKESAMPHFIAIVKALEKRYGFRFEQIDESPGG